MRAHVGIMIRCRRKVGPGGDDFMTALCGLHTYRFCRKLTALRPDTKITAAATRSITAHVARSRWIGMMGLKRIPSSPRPTVHFVRSCFRQMCETYADVPQTTNSKRAL